MTRSMGPPKVKVLSLELFQVCCTESDPGGTVCEQEKQRKKLAHAYRVSIYERLKCTSDYRLPVNL